MELLDTSCVPDIHWTITRAQNTALVPFLDFVQPGTSVLRVEPFVLEPGDYIIALEVAFPSVSRYHWSNDFIVLRILLPELLAHIAGGDYLDVPHGDVIYLDATASRDPADNLTSLDTVPINAYWSFIHYTFQPLGLEQYLKDCAKTPSAVPPPFSTSKLVTAGTDYMLHVNTNLFASYSVAITMFSLTRGQREQSTVQAIRFVPNAVPLSIK